MDRFCYRRETSQGSSNPSFSSTLLDAIYRSIDEGGDNEDLMHYRETMKKQQQGSFKDDQEMANFRRICLINKWMGHNKQEISQKVVPVRRRRSSNTMADFAVPSSKSREVITIRNRDDDAFFFKSSSSGSSESSSNGGFSSSEAESVHGVSSSTSSCYGLQKPKPVRTNSTASIRHEKPNKDIHRDGYDTSHLKPKHEGGGFTSSKLRALKMYGDLKKAKQQPISPGRKLAGFLNSLFTSGNNANKAKITSSANASTCSSASSFTRSCLSKTPSSRSSNNNGVKRSVRFCPVSVIVDEDCQPCGHKNLYELEKPSTAAAKEIRSSIDEELKLHIVEKNRRVEDAAKDLLRNYQKRVVLQPDHQRESSRTTHVKTTQAFANGGHGGDVEDDDDDDDDDDVASYASSDLFELDNLSAIGMERYREELPVYETTHLGTNRAISKGHHFVNFG